MCGMVDRGLEPSREEIAANLTRVLLRVVFPPFLRPPFVNWLGNDPAPVNRCHLPPDCSPHYELRIKQQTTNLFLFFFVFSLFLVFFAQYGQSSVFSLPRCNRAPFIPDNGRL